MKLGEIVVHIEYYNITKFYQGQMKNKKVWYIKHLTDDPSVKGRSIGSYAKNIIVYWFQNILIFDIYFSYGSPSYYSPPGGGSSSSYNSWDAIDANENNYEDEYNTEAPVWTNSPWDPYNKDSSDDTYTYGDVKYRWDKKCFKNCEIFWCCLT